MGWLENDILLRYTNLYRVETCCDRTKCTQGSKYFEKASRCASAAQYCFGNNMGRWGVQEVHSSIKTHRSAMKVAHDSSVSRHFGIVRTNDSMSVQMENKRVVSSCVSCQRSPTITSHSSGDWAMLTQTKKVAANRSIVWKNSYVSVDLEILLWSDSSSSIGSSVLWCCATWLCRSRS